MYKSVIAIASLVASVSSADCHQFWSNGGEVPPFVKSSCCGPQDVHQINPGAVHIMSDGYHIDGLNTVVPMSRVLPSPDGKIWGFWTPSMEPDPVIFCFFAPLNGT